MSRRPQLFGKTLFVDLMMSTLVVVTALLIASNAVEKEKQNKLQDESSIRTDGFYAVIMEWPDASQDDIDLYVRDPAGKIAFFSSRDVGLMHLEHDDQGAMSDQIQSEGGLVKIERNEERVILRGVIPGEYVVNVHMYNKRDPKPTPVTIHLYRLKGEDEEVAKRDLTLPNKGDELTAFRFTVQDSGSVGDINELQQPLTGGGKPPSQMTPFRFRGGQ